MPSFFQEEEPKEVEKLDKLDVKEAQRQTRLKQCKGTKKNTQIHRVTFAKVYSIKDLNDSCAESVCPHHPVYEESQQRTWSLQKLV